MVRRKTESRRFLRSIEMLESRRLLTADLNGDGRVEFEDFLILADAFGESVPFGTGADIDGDGTVGFDDFTILSNSYQASVVEFDRIPYLEPSNSEKFQAAVATTQQWQALTSRTNPGSEPAAAPIALDTWMLVFVSLGETGLGTWVEIEWVTQSETRINVGYRAYHGGVQPPPGTHVSTSMVAIPTSQTPVYFIELATISLP